MGIRPVQLSPTTASTTLTRPSTCCSAWGLELRPVEVVDGHYFLESHDQDIFNEVKAWGEMRKRLEAGEITELEYITWRDGYTAKKRMV